MGLLVSEIFHSIQGESTHAGRPCAFVRLTGCNLRCAWCDTAYSWENGRMMSQDEIIRTLKDFGCGLVEITGGEPLMQPEAPELARKLVEMGFEVLVETNGTFPVDILDERVTAIVDIKCPSSGMSEHTLWKNLELLRPKDELKFVIASREDFDYATQVVERLPVRIKHPPATTEHFFGASLLNAGRIHFSPVLDRLAPSELAAWILAVGLPVRLSLQLHKYIWSPDARGV